MKENYHWEDGGLENLLQSISGMQKMLDRDIERISKEIPHNEELDNEK